MTLNPFDTYVIEAFTHSILIFNNTRTIGKIIDIP